MNRHATKSAPEKFRATCLNPEAALLLSARKGGQCHRLLHWLANHVRGHEKITIMQWVKDRWCVIVKDTNLLLDLGPMQAGRDIVRSRIGFTVNAHNDAVCWSNAKGNCFVRDRRWLNLFRRDYGHVAHGGIHVYQMTRLVQAKPTECQVLAR